MSAFVVDASIAIKWVIPEAGTAEALSLLHGNELLAPELILPECANILWKKVRRSELSAAEARFAGKLIEASNLRLRSMLPLFTSCVRLSLDLDHPSYDCAYLALALQEGLRFVTADAALLRKLRQRPEPHLKELTLLLNEAL